MSQSKLHPSTEEAIPRRVSYLLFGAGFFVLAATLILWWQFGTQVFMEAVAAGLALCF